MMVEASRNFIFREDWSRIRRRYETWWEGQLLETPILRVTAPKFTLPPVLVEAIPAEAEELFQWFTDPTQVLPRLEHLVDSTYYTGDAFPWIDPMSQGLAAIQTAFLGAPYRIDPHTHTGWASPLFDDWSSRPRFVLNPANRWWQATQRLLEAGAQASAGRYVISLPDLQGGGEILALLRGSERLALDLFDCPQKIAPALEEINLSWLGYFRACYAIIHRWQDGYVDWLGIWSEKPAVTVECDFSVMVSPQMFERFFLPAVAQQVEWIDRTIFHLDGPGAIPHLDALLSLQKLKGVQWVPTPERPCLREWVPLLRRIQSAGKRVVVACTPEEVFPLLDALHPESLMLSTACTSPAGADDLVRQVRRYFGSKRKWL